MNLQYFQNQFVEEPSQIFEKAKRTKEVQLIKNF